MIKHNAQSTSILMHNVLHWRTERKQGFWLVVVGMLVDGRAEQRCAREGAGAGATAPCSRFIHQCGPYCKLFDSINQYRVLSPAKKGSAPSKNQSLWWAEGGGGLRHWPPQFEGSAASDTHAAKISRSATEVFCRGRLPYSQMGPDQPHLNGPVFINIFKVETL